MKPIQYFDGHIIIYAFGLMLRIKYYKNYICPTVKEYGLNTSEPPRKVPIFVSLTSFSERINTVDRTIKTLLVQTMKPDKIILWLAPEEFPNGEKDLPQALLDLKQYGLTIEWYKDIRSYKKIVPALKKYPDAIIITTDDDIYYASDTIETLYKSYLEHPNDIHAHRCDWLNVYDKSDKTYVSRAKTLELFQDKHKGEASFHNCLAGYGAVLYPPNSLYSDVTDENKFIKLLPTHDDVWLWAMATLAGTKTRLVKGYSESINYIENSQQYGLCKIHQNNKGLNFNQACHIIIKEYPQIMEKLKK